MKLKTLHLSSLIILAMILTVVSANAQAPGIYQAEIPFDFQIGDKNYEAGNYKIHLGGTSSLATIITVKKADGSALHTAAVIRNGNTSKEGETSLVFNRYGDDLVFYQIVAPNFGFSSLKSKRPRQLGRKPRKASETVSVVLKTYGKTNVE